MSMEKLEEEKIMLSYLVQVTYESKVWSVLLRNPENRFNIIAEVINDLEGTMKCAYLTFGVYDAIIIVELPDPIAAAAFSMTLMASGVFKTVKTTPLMEWEEGLEAMKKAKKVTYHPPKPDTIYLDRSS